MIIRITYKSLCFGMIASNTDPSVIVDAAPVASWAIGVNTDTVLTYWQKRGAMVEEKSEYWNLIFGENPTNKTIELLYAVKKRPK